MLLMLFALSLILTPVLISIVFQLTTDLGMEEVGEIYGKLDQVTTLSMSKFSDPQEAIKYGYSILPNYISNFHKVKLVSWLMVVSSPISLLIPAMIYSFLFHRNSELLNLKKIKGRTYFYSILAFFSSMALIGMIGIWNGKLIFPIESIQKYMLDQEVKIGIIQQCFAHMNSVKELLFIILFVGILTGIAEELTFRAALQNIIIETKINPHLAILIAAFIFSAVHMQFFGFFVRLSLGLLLGYIYYFSKDIKASIISHSFYNSLIVVFAYYAGNTEASPLDNLPNEFFFQTIISTAFCGFCLWKIYSLNKEENELPAL